MSRKKSHGRGPNHIIIVKLELSRIRKGYLGSYLDSSRYDVVTFAFRIETGKKKKAVRLENQSMDDAHARPLPIMELVNFGYYIDYYTPHHLLKVRGITPLLPFRDYHNIL